MNKSCAHCGAPILDRTQCVYCRSMLFDETMNKLNDMVFRGHTLTTCATYPSSAKLGSFCYRR